MDWGGIIAGALGGGAQAVQGMAQGYIEDERKTNVAKEISAIEEAKQLRVEEARAKRDFQYKGREITEHGPLKREEARQDTIAAADTAVQVAPKAAEAAGIIADAQAERERKKLIADVNAPGYMTALVKKTRALAQAGYIESQASLAEADLRRMEIKDKKRVGDLVEELITLDKNAVIPEDQKVQRRQQIQGEILSIKAKSGATGLQEIDTVKIVEEKMGPDGSTVKTERTERRRPGNASPAAPLKPPQGAVDFLLKNPSTAAEFEARFGQGSSQKYLSAAQDPSVVAPSKVAGRPYASATSKQLVDMLNSPRTPWLDKDKISAELESRKKGDLSPG